MKPPSRFMSGRSSASAPASSSAALVSESTARRPLRAPLAGSPPAQEGFRDRGRRKGHRAGEVARPSAPETEARKRAGGIGRPLEDEPQALAQVAVLGEESHRILPHPDRCDVGERTRRGASASRRAPLGVTVQSIVASRLPTRSPARVLVSSRFPRRRVDHEGRARPPPGSAAAGRDAVRSGSFDIERAAPAAVISVREKDPKLWRVATPKCSLSRRSAEMGSRPSRGSGVMAVCASRQSAASSGSSRMESVVTISRGSRRAISA